MTDYPDIDDDPSEGGQMIQILKEWDQPHSAKAAILVKMAQTEWKLAHKDDEPEVRDETDFGEFVEKSVDMVDEAVEHND